jgi:hypothetical protein
MEGREAPRYRLTKRGKLAFPWQHLVIDKCGDVKPVAASVSYRLMMEKVYLTAELIAICSIYYAAEASVYINGIRGIIDQQQTNGRNLHPECDRKLPSFFAISLTCKHRHSSDYKRHLLPLHNLILLTLATSTLLRSRFLLGLFLPRFQLTFNLLLPARLLACLHHAAKVQDQESPSPTFCG